MDVIEILFCFISLLIEHIVMSMEFDASYIKIHSE